LYFILLAYVWLKECSLIPVGCGVDWQTNDLTRRTQHRPRSLLDFLRATAYML